MKTSASITTPAQVQKAAAFGGGFLTNVITAAGGENHSLAADRDGRVWSFGENASRQLGDGGATDAAAAVRVLKSAGVELASVDSVAGGTSFSLARDTAGKVWGWGVQTSGRCGTGIATGYAAYATPVKVDTTINASAPALANIAAIAAGGAFGVAAEPKTIDGTGKLWAWGQNTSGQLGDGTVTQRNAAVWVRKSAGGVQFDNVVDVAAGDAHAAAVVRSATENGTVWCWGTQADGRLGNTLTSAVDVKIPVRAYAQETAYPYNQVSFAGLPVAHAIRWRLILKVGFGAGVRMRRVSWDGLLPPGSKANRASLRLVDGIYS